MVKRTKKCFDTDVSVRNIPYSLRPRKEIFYNFKRTRKHVNVLHQIKEENQLDYDEKYVDFSSLDNPLKIKQELLEVINNESDCNISNNIGEEVGKTKLEEEKNGSSNNSFKLKQELLDVINDEPHSNILNDNGTEDGNINLEKEKEENFIIPLNINDNGCLNEIKIKQELINEETNSFSSLTDYSIVKVKEEPLSQPLESVSEINSENDHANIYIDSSAIKYENFKENIHDELFPVGDNCISIDRSFNKIPIIFDSSKVDNIKKETYVDITDKPCDNDIEVKSLIYEHSIFPHSMGSNRFIPPKRIKKKVVLIKEEELPEKEKEIIEEEKDNACRAAAAKTGGIWRRLPRSKCTFGHIPKVPDVVHIYTPAGQRFELYTNEDRPDEFPTKEDQEQWDHATRINVLRAMSDIEDGYSIPPGVDIEKEIKFKNTKIEWDQACETIAEVYTEKGGDFSKELRFFEADEKLQRWHLWVKTRLPLGEPQVFSLLNKIILSDLHEFHIIKNFYIIETIKKVMQQNEYIRLKDNATVLFKKIQNICQKTKTGELEHYIHDKASKLLEKCKNYPLPLFNLLTPNCEEVAELYKSPNLEQYLPNNDQPGDHSISTDNDNEHLLESMQQINYKISEE